jgi:uncharacterized protein (TIGR04255 family)
MSGTTPTFKNPPVVEFVLGVQFSPLVRLTTGHLGLFWQMLGVEEWGQPEDSPPIPDQFELFGPEQIVERPGVRFRIGNIGPLGRFVLKHNTESRLVQVQASRFHLNWRSNGDLKPSYNALVGRFFEAYGKFADFVSKYELGELIPNQWEITYVDSYRQKEYEWESPEDWPKIIPGLFGKLTVTNDLTLDHRAAAWSFIIPPSQGRLHISAHMGKWRDDPEDTLIVDMTARGPIGKGGVTSLKEGLDIGHRVSVESFIKMTSEKVKEKWGTNK